MYIYIYLYYKISPLYAWISSFRKQRSLHSTQVLPQTFTVLFAFDSFDRKVCCGLCPQGVIHLCSLLTLRTKWTRTKWTRLYTIKLINTSCSKSLLHHHFRAAFCDWLEGLQGPSYLLPPSLPAPQFSCPQLEVLHPAGKLKIMKHQNQHLPTFLMYRKTIKNSKPQTFLMSTRFYKCIEFYIILLCKGNRIFKGTCFATMAVALVAWNGAGLQFTEASKMASHPSSNTILKRAAAASATLATSKALVKSASNLLIWAWPKHEIKRESWPDKPKKTVSTRKIMRNQRNSISFCSSTTPEACRLKLCQPQWEFLFQARYWKEKAAAASVPQHFKWMAQFAMAAMVKKPREKNPKNNNFSPSGVVFLAGKWQGRASPCHGFQDEN